MSSVSGVGGNNGVVNTNSAPASGPSSAASTAAANNAPHANRAGEVAASGPIASGAKAAGVAKIKVTGIAEAVAKNLKMPSYRPSPGQLAGTAQWGTASSWGGPRGYIDAEVAPAVGGWVFKVHAHHQKPGENINLFLSARVVDPPKEHWIVLGVPHSGPMNPKGKDADGMEVSNVEFFVSLDEINKFLLKKAGTKADGKTPKLQFKPGDPLVVDATWQDNGHQAGGRRDQTKGYVNTPQPLGRTSAVDVLAGTAAVGEVQTASIGSAADKPVDLTLKLPAELVAQYPKVLAKDAKMVSRRESELKLEPKSFDELKEFTVNLIKLTKLSPRAQAEELKKIFGESGWSIHLTDRYYQKDRKGEYVLYKPGEMVWTVKDDNGEATFDFAGLPKVAGMYDKYQDFVRPKNSSGYYGAKSFQVALENGAVRFRDGEIKSGENKPTIGKFNLKPGGGVMDPTCLIANRIEYSLDTLPGIANDAAAMTEMQKFLDSAPAPYNPMVEFKKKDYQLSGKAVETNVLDNNAQRYKFTLKNKSGLELEISNDFITLTSQNEVIEPPSTKGKSDVEKFAHWQKEFEAQKLAFSDKPGAVNKGTFVEYANGGKHRIEVSVEAAVDAAGKKSVKETLAVHGRQVEIEMDHVQLFTTGPVQGPYAGASETGTMVQSQNDEDNLFKSISDKATLSGPPTIHNLEDLKDPALYAEGSYRQMREAGIKLRQWAFPKGVNPTRQKAAYGLEMMGQIAADSSPRLYINVQKDKADDVQVNSSNQSFTVTGDFKSKKRATLEIRVNDFPFMLHFKGTETAKQVAQAIAAEVDKFVLQKAQLSESGKTCTVAIVAR